MDGDLLATPFGLFLAALSITAVFVWCLVIACLWNGYHVLKRMRARLGWNGVCTKCGREILAIGAQFCGRCGGKVAKAA